MTNINISINGQTTSYPTRDGVTAEELLDNDDFLDIFQVPDNVSAIVNGTAANNRTLQNGDTVTFQTKASSKAA